jgi:hypothetical protein
VLQSMARPALWRTADIGRYLGVTKQRAHQIVWEPGFPNPVDEDALSLLWDGAQVRRWSRAWVKAKSWRRPAPSASPRRRAIA